MNSAAGYDCSPREHATNPPVWRCDVCARTRDVREVPGFGCPLLCTPCRILFAPLWTMQAGDLSWWGNEGT